MSARRRCAPRREINYLAKDYASFRQLILDRLALTMPDWQETHVPDIGIMLVELLAYVGDQLSYYQDAVATEAYLGTARQRISVRRHARLVDYALHEGCNARAWITIATNSDKPSSTRRTSFFARRFPARRARRVLQPERFRQGAGRSCDDFRAAVCRCSPRRLRCARRTTKSASTPGATAPAACPGAPPAQRLPTPGLRATLARAPSISPATTPDLRRSDRPGYRQSGGRRPTHRQAVRLTKVTPELDPLYQPTTRPASVEIEWCAEDALTFPLCISARDAGPGLHLPRQDQRCPRQRSAGRQGATITETLGTVPTQSSTPTCATDCEPAGVVVTAGPFRPALQQTPLTFAQVCCRAAAPPSSSRRIRPCAAVVTLTGTAR